MITKIANAKICDGSGAPVYSGDILIKDSKIEAIGKFNMQCDNTIDAKDMLATPGFIDTHRHLDFAAIENPDFGIIELAQGITTGVAGNCGLSAYPCNLDTKSEWHSYLSPCLGETSGDYNCYKTVGAYLNCVQSKKPRINVGALVGLGAVKVNAKGFAQTPFTKEEMRKAKEILCQSLEDGALGMSCGIMYAPECYTTKEEYIELLSVTSKYSRIITAHIRGEGNILVPSVKEVIEIAKAADIKLNISHFKSVGKKNWQSEIFKAIELIENERALGALVTADVYPFIGGATTLISLIPPTFIEPTIAQTLSKLSTESGIEKLRKELNTVFDNWDNMMLDIGWERIIISGVTLTENAKYQGLSIAQICEKYKYSNPIKFISELLCAENANVSIIVMSMCEEDLQTILKLPYTNIISDSLYTKTDTPHPRLYASFPKILRHYVKELNILSLEQAVHKMTLMPAERFGIQNKGILKAGADADINLFKLEDVKDNADFGKSNILASGINTVFVGGKIAMQNNVPNLPHGTAIKAF